MMETRDRACRYALGRDARCWLLTPAPGDISVTNDLYGQLKASDHGLDLHFLVELRGFEPLTPSMRTRLLQVHWRKWQKPGSAAPLQRSWSDWGGSPTRRPHKLLQLIKEEGKRRRCPGGSRHLCISRVRDEVACRNISMVELVVCRCLDEAYLGISADVLIRPATAALPPSTQAGTVQRWLNSMTVRSAGSISSGSPARITTSTAVPSGRPRCWRSSTVATRAVTWVPGPLRTTVTSVAGWRTNVPMPRVVMSRPSLRSAASASRTASLPTLYVCDSDASDGRAAPGRR
jgi:hypothetical protein